MREGEYVFQQGEPVRDFFALLDGEVEVLRRREDGAEERLNRLKAGEYFGENSLLEGSSKRNVSIRCTSPVVEVLKLSKEDFEAAFGVHRAGAQGGVGGPLGGGAGGGPGGGGRGGAPRSPAGRVTRRTSVGRS